jgi:branched-chain amino acid transport system substrate-binding protein
MRWRKLELLVILGFALATMAPARAEIRIGLGLPLTGAMGWGGGDTLEGAEIAVAGLNAQSGVLGEQIEMITADDYCDSEQTVAAANKLN